MKTIIVALLCVANVTCFAMNKDKDTRELVELKERKVKALELFAVSQAMHTCLELEKHNDKSLLRYDEPSCLLLSYRYRDLVNKNINGNS